MEDIIIDDRRQVSARVNKRNQQNNKNTKRTLGQYLADLLTKGLLGAALLCLNFVLFAKSGSYSIFTGLQTINTEALLILAVLAGGAFAINMLLSFSKFLQNLWVTIIATFFISATINQFGLFDKQSFLAGKFGDYLPEIIVGYLNTSSYLIMIAAGAIFTFLLLSFSRRMTQLYLLGILLFIFGWNFGSNYFKPSTTYFQTVYSNPPLEQKEDGKRLIYLTFTGLTTYETLQSLNTPTPEKADKETAADIMLGFYTQNNFKFYINTYSHNKNPFENIVLSLNLVPTDYKVDNYLLSNVLLQSHWNFDDIQNQTLYLKNNKLFRELKKEDYSINVYETHGLETCYYNNEIAVNKCVKKENIPFDMESTTLTTEQKTILLLDQWIESTGLIDEICIVNDILKLAISSQNFPQNDFSSKQLSVINSFKNLDIIARDIEKDEGNAAYFATMEIPADIYVYNSLCKLKPISQWISANSTNAQKKKEAYAEQISCLYGQLENFIEKLKNADRLKNTTLVIQGLNTPNRLIPLHPNQDIAKEISNKGINLAIYNSENQKAEIIYDLCPINTILQTLLGHPIDCKPLSDFKIEDTAQAEILKTFEEKHLSEKDIEKSLNNFINWYQEWADANGAENNLKTLVTPPQPQEDISTTPEAQEIKETPITEATEELPPEAENQSLNEAQETIEQRPEAEPQIKIEAKVVELNNNEKE